MMSKQIPAKVGLILSQASYVVGLLFLMSQIMPAAVFASEGKKSAEQQVFVVNDYRYDPADSGGDPDNGHALCGTRCNAMSYDYRNVLDPGGWRYILVAKDRELTVPLNNPFLGGFCICTVDEYVIKINDFDRPKQ